EWRSGLIWLKAPVLVSLYLAAVTLPVKALLAGFSHRGLRLCLLMSVASLTYIVLVRKVGSGFLEQIMTIVPQNIIQRARLIASRLLQRFQRSIKEPMDCALSGIRGGREAISVLFVSPTLCLSPLLQSQGLPHMRCLSHQGVSFSLFSLEE